VRGGVCQYSRFSGDNTPVMNRRNFIHLFFLVTFFPVLLLAQSGKGQDTAQLTVRIKIVPSVGIIVPAIDKPRLESANTADPASTFGGVFVGSGKNPAVAFHITTQREQLVAVEATRSITTKSGKSAELVTTTVVLR
jgi:hypothetical protein